MKRTQRMVKSILISLLVAGQGLSLQAQNDTTLQEALKDNAVDDFWHYDSLESAMEKAKTSGKPLLVTIRCVPCKACMGMDSKVVSPTDPELRELMDQFVCVRIIQAWGLDLSLFQYDMNMSWAAFLLNSERVIYGRYGTRAAQRDEKAITVPGFKRALKEALKWHERYQKHPELITKKFAGKSGPVPRWKRTEDIPAIPKTVRWDKRLGRMTAQQNTSCVHCHFVPAAQIMGLMSLNKPITDRHLWAYPLPETVGLKLDPDQIATISQITVNSPAEKAGLQVGDRVGAISGQPIVSIADVQWALHRAKDTDQLRLSVTRAGESTLIRLTMPLPNGWRRNGEFVERVSSWDLFKVKLFGVAKMPELNSDERKQTGIKAESTALRVEKLAPSWGGMNQDVRKAGLKEGDIVIEIDGRTDISDHSGLLAYLVQEKKSGDTLKLTVLRGGTRKAIQVPLNWEDRIKALRTP